MLKRLKPAAEFAYNFFGFAILLYAVCNFFYEIVLNQLQVQSVWLTLSLEQRALENITLCLQDLNFLIAFGLLLFFLGRK